MRMGLWKRMKALIRSEHELQDLDLTPPPEKFYSARMIGSMCSPIISSHEVNTLLEFIGYQIAYRQPNEQLMWRTTDVGKEHSTPKLSAEETGSYPKYNQWKISVVEKIQSIG